VLSTADIIHKSHHPQCLCPVPEPFTRYCTVLFYYDPFIFSRDKPSNTKFTLPNMSPFGKPSGCYREVGNACGLLWERTRIFGFYKMRGIALRPENLPPTKEKFGSTVLVTANVWMIANIQCYSVTYD
jgi:hypothetical protein